MIKSTLSLEKTKTLFNIPNSWHTYFDAETQHFNQNSHKEKISNLARMIYFKVDLYDIINEYKLLNRDNNKCNEHIRKTFIGYISFLKTGVTCDYGINIKYQKTEEEEIIKDFVELIKTCILPSFDFNTYKKGYLDFKSGGLGENYFSQKAFFKINLEKELDFMKELEGIV
jgi:hypothetical protein